MTEGSVVRIPVPTVQVLTCSWARHWILRCRIERCVKHFGLREENRCISVVRSVLSSIVHCYLHYTVTSYQILLDVEAGQIWEAYEHFKLLPI